MSERYLIPVAFLLIVCILWVIGMKLVRAFVDPEGEFKSEPMPLVIVLAVGGLAVLLTVCGTFVAMHL